MKTVWKCDRCNYRTSIHGLFKRHVVTHSIGPIVCPECGRKENNTEAFVDHMKHHQRNKILKCSFCGYTGTSFWMRLHVGKHRKVSESFSCLLCDFSTDAAASFQSHMQDTHTRSVQVVVERLDVDLNDIDNALRRQLDLDLKETAEHGCIYSPEPDLTSELPGSPNAIPPPQADSVAPNISPKNPGFSSCEVALPSLIELTVGTAPNPKILNCDKCQYTTRKPSLLERHAAKHLIDPSFSCTYCDFKELSSVKFAEHLATLHSNRQGVLCCFCSFSSQSKDSLRRHLLSHRPVLMADCSECELAFSSQFALNKHFRKVHMPKGKSTKESVVDCNTVTRKRKHNDAFRKSVGATSCGNVNTVESIDSHNPPLVMNNILDPNVPTMLPQSLTAHNDPCSPKPLYQCNSCSFCTKRKRILRQHVVKHLLPGSKFTCPECGLLESSTESFLAHLTNHQPKENWLNCCYCEFVAAKPRDLRRHLEVHRDVTLFDCPECGRSYRHFDSLRKHCTEFHVKNVECADCHKVMTGAKLQSHKLQHMGKEAEVDPSQDVLRTNPPVSFEVPSCSTSMSQTAQENTSIRSSFNLSAQMANMTYRCSSCDYGTDIESLFTRHIAKHQMSEAKVACPICQLATDDLVLFARHLSAHYNQAACCFCSMKTNSRGKLVRHLSTHRSVHLHDCAMCDRSYTSRLAVTRHYIKWHVQENGCGESRTPDERLGHGKSLKTNNTKSYLKLFPNDPSVFHCYHCDYVTKRKSLLRRHAVKHFLDARLVCRDCGFKDNSAREFAKHCLLCQGGLRCSECSFSTHSLSNLTQHIGTHRSVPIHDCSKCEMSCTIRPNLRDHYKKMHVAQHQCTYCDKTMTRYELNRHKSKHLESSKAPCSEVADTHLEKSDPTNISHVERSSIDTMEIEHDLVVSQDCSNGTATLDEHVAELLPTATKIKTEPWFLEPENDDSQIHHADDGRISRDVTRQMTTNHQIKLEPITLAPDVIVDSSILSGIPLGDSDSETPYL